jgi:hypothetical protein
MGTKSEASLKPHFLPLYVEDLPIIGGSLCFGDWLSLQYAIYHISKLSIMSFRLSLHIFDLVMPYCLTSAV